MSGSNKYQITGGTGKMKGIKGSGTCKLTGTADGGTEYSCTGEYTIAAAAPAKKYNKQNKEDNREGQAAELPFSLLLSATSEARVAVKFYCTCGLLLAQRPTAAFEIF